MSDEGRLPGLADRWAKLRAEHASAAAVLVLAALLILALAPYARRQHFLLWWLTLLVPVIALSVRRLRRYQTARRRAWRLKQFYTRSSQRANGEWAGHGFPGDEFASDDHLYARDLGVCGEGSLFELLCIARTAIGRRHLADYLLNSAGVDEARLRQEAVRELAQRRDLREEAALLGKYESAESRWETFAKWLDEPPLVLPEFLRVVARVSSGLLAGIVFSVLLTAGTGLAPWIRIVVWAGPLVVFHAAVGLAFRKRVKQSIHGLHTLSAETRTVREGLRLLESQRFRSPKLALLAERVRHGAWAVRRLEWLLEGLNQRDRDGFYFLSRALLGGTQLCMAVEQWKRRHGEDLRSWLAAWGEFEALNCLGNYALEHASHTFPEFSQAGTCFEARALGHPLLPREACVRNDVVMNAARRFYVISGSNMSGKSTLLRSIGLNAVLAFAGAPVRAEEMQISAVSVCAAISAVDSLLKGKSKFLTEVERLRQTIEAAASGRPVLFLIDEIFSGTNSHDRRAAAEAVVRTLIAGGAIGALSTHDMSLTEIADAVGLAGENVHMGSRESGDPMDFDYLLKPGVTTETNALAIARMAGVRV